MSDKIRKGRAGEQQAADYLRAKGYQIRIQNYRAGRAEIDLIAEKDGWLIFVEVKLRSHDAFGYPETFVDARQQRLIFQAATRYQEEAGWHGPVRYDIVAIREPAGQPVEINHFEDAFF